jgi:hypothetical protein
MMASAIISDTIPCDRLCVDEDGDRRSRPTPEPVPVAETTVSKPALETVNHRNQLTIDSLALAAMG